MITKADFEAALLLGCLWAQEQEALILRSGVALTDAQLLDAERVGVIHAQAVRLLQIDMIRPPNHPTLNALAVATGLISPATFGLTLRYGIFIRQDHWLNRRLVVHELVHTMQYERFGGIQPFLREYLAECLNPPGYPHGALETEAFRLARAVCG